MITVSTFQSLWKKYETFGRYAIVGGLGTAVDIGVLFVLTELSGIDPQINSCLFSLFVTAAFIAAVGNNYILNRIWTFKSQDSNLSAQFFRFLIVSLGGFLLTQALMWLIVKLGVWYILAKASTSMAVLIWNFGLNRMWTFRQTTPVRSTILSS